MTEDDIFATVQRLLREGADPAAVDARIAALREQGYTKHPNFFSMRMAHESADDRAEADMLIQQDIGGHPVRETANSMLQGLGFGGTDELVELIGRATGSERLQQNARQQRSAQADRRQFAPGADAVAQVAGGLMLPGPGASQFINKGGGLFRSGLQAVGRGAALGGISGAATGALAADPGERSERALQGGIAGTVIGAPLGGIGGLFSALAGRGQASRRMAQGLAEKAGFDGIADVAATTARRNIQRARAETQMNLYQPLERAHANVTDAPLRSMVRRIGGTQSGLSGTVPRAMREGRGNIGFRDLQNIRSNLRERAFARDGSIRSDDALNAYNNFTEQMNQKFGAAFQEANTAWERTFRMEEALESGLKTWDGSLDVVTAATDRLRDPELRATYNQGRLSKWMSEISRGQGARQKLLGLQTDWDRQAALGSAFPGGANGESFEGFMELVAQEVPKEQLNRYIERAFVSGGVAVTGGIIGGLVSRSRGSGGLGN